MTDIIRGDSASVDGLRGRDVLRLFDLSPQEVDLVLTTAAEQKASWASGRPAPLFPGRAVAVILEKPSMRTRCSFEVGCSRLGAHPVIMSDDHSAFSRGESVKDTTCVMDRFFDAIVIRTFEQDKVEEIATWAKAPVINALTDAFHPCQGLADLLTIYEHKGRLKGVKLAYVGDGNNMASTYLEAGALCGMDVRIATPAAYACDEGVLAEAGAMAEETGASIHVGTVPEEAVAGADVVLTDTWASMGDEAEHDERVAAFEGFRVDEALMSKADADALFMHCLPAHRGEEVTDEVMDGARSVIYDEAENRLHAQQALLSLVLTKDGE